MGQMGQSGSKWVTSITPEQLIGWIWLRRVQNITTKVLNTRRDISIKDKADRDNDDQIRVISTFMADEKLIKVVKDCEESLKLTPSFRNQRGPLFSYVKKVGANIRSHVNGLKKQALGTTKGAPVKCNGRGCKTCNMLLLTGHCW